MNELTKTMTFVGVAVVMAAVAVGSHFMNRPTNSADFELVGQPFFETFDSASQAQSLEVVAMDSETARLKRFSIENQDGLWRIPSHSNYPAEAAARLATTATSVMGLERESLAGRLANEHEKLGVVDPLDESLEDPEAAGKRITLKDANGEVVVDYIIGNEAGDVVLSGAEAPFGQQGNEKYYYVRRPDENQTYKVKLEIDLSTKFSDWIDPDLLRLERNELTKVNINNYSVEEQRSPLGQTVAMMKKQGDVLNLSRATPTDTWMLEGLNEATEELANSRVNQILGVLDELKIAGVRPKFKYKDHLLLTPDLKLNDQPEFHENEREYGAAIDRLQDELDQRGFNLAGSENKLELVSKYGELTIGTDKGVQYTLHIGNPVEGDETEIEIGASSDEPVQANEGTAEKEAATEESSADGEANADGEEPDTDAEADNRYLLVRVALDESLINPKPEKPVEPVAPVAPEGYQPAADDAQEKEPEVPEAIAAPEDVEAPEGEDAGGKQQESKPRDPLFVKHDEVLKAFEESKVQYELDLTRFEDDTKAFAEKVAEAQKLVDELNERFGEWFYVMSADNLNTLRTERVDLVTEKEPEPGSESAVPTTPDISFPDLPIGNGAVEPAKTPTEPAVVATEPVGVATEPAGEAAEPAVGESEEASVAEPKGEATEPQPEVNDVPVEEAGAETPATGDSPAVEAEPAVETPVETQPSGGAGTAVETEPAPVETVPAPVESGETTD